MSRRRRILRWALILLAIFVPLNVGLGTATSFWMVHKLREGALPGVKLGPAHWSFPIGMTVYGVRLPDPTSKNDFLLQADRVTFQVPLWGVLVRPLPVKIILQNPHLKIGSENINLLIGGMSSDPTDWFMAPFRGISKEGSEGLPSEGPLSKLPFLPFGLRVSEGRVDVIEPDIRAGQPVFIAGHVNLSMELTSLLFEPTIRLRSQGDFITPSGEVIGKEEVDMTAQPRKLSLEGVLRLRHERLGDFRNIYQYAPRPVFIENGIADFSMRFTLTQGNHVRLTASTLVQNLDLNGMVGDVRWADIMHAVEDEHRIYQWTVSTEGNLDDPAFNPHDYVLSEVEWKMKEKAASRGVEIREQMFFYADSPDAEELANPPPSD